MCGVSTAKRRRRQAAMGNKHVAKLGRRTYSKHSHERTAARLAELVQAERMRAFRKGQKTKK